jgi:hypothetical protein|tara:strand:+ start:379 stop:516 length:138 start_codon:yes stop_codon:yes gene_type:complete
MEMTATIKYSQDTGKGAWKAVEVGAEATSGRPAPMRSRSWRLNAT